MLCYFIVIDKNGLVDEPHRQPHRYASTGSLDAELIDAPTADELQAKTASIDALVWVPGVAAAEVTQAFETLQPKWVHSFPAGVDGLSGFLSSEALQSRKVPVTNGKGAFSSSLAEYVIAAIMHFTKQIPRCLTNQKEKKTTEAFQKPSATQLNLLKSAKNDDYQLDRSKRDNSRGY